VGKCCNFKELMLEIGTDIRRKADVSYLSTVLVN